MIVGTENGSPPSSPIIAMARRTVSTGPSRAPMPLAIALAPAGGVAVAGIVGGFPAAFLVLGGATLVAAVVEIGVLVLGWLILPFYFITSGVYLNWPIVDTPDLIGRLFIGVGAVGIWDELFFICIVFAMLRRHFPVWQCTV